MIFFQKRFLFKSLVLFLFISQSCTSIETKSLDQIVKGSITTIPSRGDRVPMSLKLNFNTLKPCRVTTTIQGNQPVIKTDSSYSKIHSIPIVGLYPDTVNKIVIDIVDKDNNNYSGEILTNAPKLPSFFPDIEITKLDRSKMEPGFHKFEFLNPEGKEFDSYSIIFDDEGIIRWYLDMSENRRLTFSTPIKNSKNTIHVSWIDVLETNQIGETIQQWQLGGYAGDHDIKQLPNGNFIMGASKRNSTIFIGKDEVKSRYDFVVELEKGSMNAIKEWDLREVLDVDRDLLNSSLGRDNYMDWFHINSINYTNDNCIIVSGRNQGIVKLDQNNNIKWILAPHRGWKNAGPNGKGQSLREYLLTAIDSTGKPFSSDIQNGIETVEGFNWVFGQHSIQLLENGNLLVFDNGFKRNFNLRPTYSKAVEYKIDEDNRTIQEVWQYGKERALDMYSAITSNVDVLPKTNNRFITAGYVRMSNKPAHAKMIEITYPDNKEVFEAEIYFKNVANKELMEWAKFDIVYKGERFSF